MRSVEKGNRSPPRSPERIGLGSVYSPAAALCLAHGWVLSLAERIRPSFPVPEQTMSTSANIGPWRRRFTVEEYNHLAERGFFDTLVVPDLEELTITAGELLISD
jgi:hypothetical protein